MNRPHKHAALIKAWADGAEIQYQYSPDCEWVDKTTPEWCPQNKYRIKPKTIKYRLYVYKRYGEELCVHICVDPTLVYSFEGSPTFVKWLGDWQVVEIY